MTDDGTFGLSRRRILAAAGTVGGAGLLGGAGVTALLWDEEKFGTANDPNVLQAGALDLGVDWEVRYYDWIDNDGDGETGERDESLQASQALVKNDAGPDGPNDQPGPIIDLQDVKPGDVLETTLSAHVFDNPAFLGFHYEEHLDSDNGITEPEDKVNGHTPDDSDGDPFAAGLGLFSGGLLAGALPGGVFDGGDASDDAGIETTGSAPDDGDGDWGLPTRQHLLRAGVAGGAGATALAGGARAAPGDKLGDVTLPDNLDGGTCSVAGTFDGTYYATIRGGSDGEESACKTTTLQIYEPPSGAGEATLVAEKQIVNEAGDPLEISALEWDPTRGQYWAANGQDGTAYLLDRGDPTDGSENAVATGQFDISVAQNFTELMDGIAYDAGDDTVWFSADVASIVWQFDAETGEQLGFFQPKNADDTVAGENSGIAVGADRDGRPTMYVGLNGQARIVHVFADDGEHISEFATTAGRVEGLSCDPINWDVDALLAKDAENNLYEAFEVEAGSCPLPDDGEQPEDGDGELDDVTQCVVWYDDGDNIPGEIWTGETDLPDGPEDSPDDTLDPATREAYLMELGEAQSPSDVVDTGEAIFTGTLDEMDGADVLFDARESVAGSVADTFPETACYQNSDTEYVGILCWIPRDIEGVNDNVIQTDRLEFQFGFDAIQCRHNVANDGGPIDGTLDDADAENNARTP